MMDVFVSYSRKDRAEADALCGALEAAGVNYWIDRSEIHGSANFLTEITRNIKACKVLIFIASANSAVSEYTQKEVLYALKHKKPIIPYKIGEFRFEDNDELDFIFTNVQWVESPEEVVRSLERSGFVGVAQPEPVEKPTPNPQSRPTQRTYKVGDLYDDGIKRGVVFEVTPDGRHGKIVSLEEAKLSWDDKMVFRIRKRVGADSKTDGEDNLKAIRKVENWRYGFPAFAWCADLGEGWYLPATKELASLLEKATIKLVNENLGKVGKIITSGFGADSSYWSSTESMLLYAYYYFPFFGRADLLNKGIKVKVRAVAKF